MMIPLAYAYYSWTTTPSSIYIDASYTIRLYETGVADLTVLIYGIVASGQYNLTPRTEAVPASTVLTNTKKALLTPMYDVTLHTERYSKSSKLFLKYLSDTLSRNSYPRKEHLSL
jgi:hypothetical protein